jgi:hypothetical protein
MRRTFSGLTILVLSAVVLVGSPASAEKKKKDLDKDLDKDKSSEKLVKAGVVVGKVMAVYDDKRQVRIQYDIPIPKLNVAAITGLQQAQAQLTQAMRTRNVQGMLQARQQMMQHQRNMYTYTKKSVDMTIEARDDAIVRILKPKADFDDKGKPKKYTKKELKELKGDPKLPGYKAEFGDIGTDQQIKVQLVRKKSEKTEAKPLPKRKKGKDDDVIAPGGDDLGENIQQASMIIIIAEAPPGK